MTLTKEEKGRRLQERRQKKYNETHKIVDGTDLKLCNKCNKWIPCDEEHFYKNSSNGIDGFYPHCKKCGIESSSKWRRENLEKNRINQRRYTGTKSHKMSLERRRDDPKKKQYQKEWRKNNPDRLRHYREQHAYHKITKQEWNLCKEYFENECAYCGLNILEHYISWNGELKKSDFHKEHVDHTGANDLSNCVPSCRSCNGKKWKYPLEEWYTEDNEFHNGFSKDRLYKIYKWLYEDHKLYIVY